MSSADSLSESSDSDKEYYSNPMQSNRYRYNNERRVQIPPRSLVSSFSPSPLPKEYLDVPGVTK